MPSLTVQIAYCKRTAYFDILSFFKSCRWACIGQSWTHGTGYYTLTNKATKKRNCKVIWLCFFGWWNVEFSSPQVEAQRKRLQIINPRVVSMTVPDRCPTGVVPAERCVTSGSWRERLSRHDFLPESSDTQTSEPSLRTDTDTRHISLTSDPSKSHISSHTNMQTMKRTNCKGRSVRRKPNKPQRYKHREDVSVCQV